MQWGSLDFHKKSLANLGEAMKRTRKLCAVMVDTIGRELIINRPTTDDQDGWPKFEKGISVSLGDKVRARHCLLLVCESCFQGVLIAGLQGPRCFPRRRAT